VYEHLELPCSEHFLFHLSRICRSGGWLFLSTPNRLVEAPFLKSAGKSYRYHVNSVSPSEFKTRLKRHFRSVNLFGQRARAPWIKTLLRAADVLNVRHRLLSYSAKQRVDKVLSNQPFSERPEFRDIRIRRSLVRQSGIIVAACRK
jgi:2-polyprenyl-3-methyl-5-hydroxy-6-metoxy-1,4-benzoquinol methylase